MTSSALERLSDVIARRIGEDPTKSYTAKLVGKGISHIAKKLGEEAVEVVIAATERDQRALVNESADLLYHWLVLLAAMDLPPSAVLDELDRRHGVSGLEEKAARKDGA